MTDFTKMLAGPPVGNGKPALTAARKALLESAVLSADALLHGAYYSGLLDDTTTIGRWHAHKRRFVFWEHNMGRPKLKAAPHVAAGAAGACFAPLSKVESEDGNRISDFAFETTR